MTVSIIYLIFILSALPLMLIQATKQTSYKIDIHSAFLETLSQKYIVLLKIVFLEK